MRRHSILCLVAALLFLMVQATVKCPLDDSKAYFTGKTKISENGKLLKEYKCTSYSHLFWQVP